MKRIGKREKDIRWKERKKVKRESDRHERGKKDLKLE